MKPFILILFILSALSCTKEEPAPLAVPPAAEQINRPVPVPALPAPTVIPSAPGFTVSDLDAVRQAATALTVYFCFDCDAIDADAAGNLDTIAGALQSVPGARLQIVGGADERGSEEYNLNLGQRRAVAAKNFLRQAGIPNEITTVSVGEGNPVCSRHTERCWRQNRRAEFSVTR